MEETTEALTLLHERVSKLEGFGGFTNPFSGMKDSEKTDLNQFKAEFQALKGDYDQFKADLVMLKADYLKFKQEKSVFMLHMSANIVTQHGQINYLYKKGGLTPPVLPWEFEAASVPGTAPPDVPEAIPAGEAEARLRSQVPRVRKT